MRYSQVVDSTDDFAPLPREALLVGSHKSCIYHMHDCEWAREIIYAKYFLDSDDAESVGYRACEVCSPKIQHRWHLTKFPEQDVTAVKVRRLLFPRVDVGDTVTVRLADGEIETVRLGNSAEPTRPKTISIDSPLGRAVLHQRLRDSVEIKVEGRPMEIAKIIDIAGTNMPLERQ
jgi:hypothetical protein